MKKDNGIKFKVKTSSSIVKSSGSDGSVKKDNGVKFHVKVKAK
jgi:hypothetical protein